MKTFNPIIPPLILLIGIIGWAIISQQSPKNKDQPIEKPSISAITKEIAKKGVQKGNMAPDFVLTTSAGEQTKLSDYRGKKVILNFWATWCPPCKAEMPNIEEFYKGNQSKNIVVLAVNLTTAEKNKDDIQQFIKKDGLTFPVLLDEKGNIGTLYQAFTIPTSYIIDSKGIVQQKFVGPMSIETIETLVSGIQ